MKKSRTKSDWKAGTVSKSRYNSNSQAIVSNCLFKKLIGYDHRLKQKEEVLKAAPNHR